MSSCVTSIACLATTLLASAVAADLLGQQATVEIGARWQLLADHHLVDELGGTAELRLHKPRPRGIVVVFDKPWEGNTSWVCSVFRDGDIYRMYYRGWNHESVGGKTTHPAYLCYAESKDGIHWQRPELGLFEFAGSKKNNIIFESVLVPFKDTNPNCSPEAKYKGLGFEQIRQPSHKRVLFAYQSPDGIRWTLMRQEPVMTEGVTYRAFDSVNVGFWDSVRGEYRAYVRDWRGEMRDVKRQMRDIKTSTSRDFVNWSAPQWLTYQNTHQRHLYTNMVHPYEANPRLFIGFPTRYLPNRGSVTEPLFMTSRDGRAFHLWEEAIIRPGRNPHRWGNRCNYISYGLVNTQTDLPGRPQESSIYATERFYMKGGTKVRRFTYRPGGFVSVCASFEGGTILTKPFRFSGTSLLLNVSTAAAGSVRVELQDRAGKKIPGYGLDDSREFYGDQIEQSVKWQHGSDVSYLQEEPIRLLLQLKDADVYAFRFGDGGQQSTPSDADKPRR